MAFKPLYDQLTHGPFLGSGDHYSPARADLAGLLEAVRKHTTWIGESGLCGHVCRVIWAEWARRDLFIQSLFCMVG